MRIVDKGTGDVMKNFFVGRFYMGLISLEDLKNNEEIRALFEVADRQLAALGYTEHSFRHVGLVAKEAGEYLRLWDFLNGKLSLPKLQAISMISETQ